MKRLFVLLLLLCVAIFSRAQTQQYGIIDTADLKLTACDFEKGANIMVLYDKTDVKTDDLYTIITRHRRVKILNSLGLDAGNVTIAFHTRDHFETLSNLDAQTINFKNGKLTFSPVDKSLIYQQASDKNNKKIAISFPDVRPGSVIEYTFKRTIDYPGALPDFDFQEDVPVKYAEYNANIDRGYIFRVYPRVSNEYVENVKEARRGLSGDSIGIHYQWAFKNINSFKNEPYATTPLDNIQNIRFFEFKTPFANRSRHATTWQQIAALMLGDGDLTEQLHKNLDDDQNIVTQAKQRPTEEEKIAFIFEKVKNAVKWNGYSYWFTGDGIKKAWGKKTGNNAEINLILYNFLRMAGIKSQPTYVSTRENRKIEFNLPDMDEFNTMVLTVNTKSDKALILDASNRFNSYKTIPFYLLNCYALFLDPEKGTYELKAIKDATPERKTIFVNAQITATSKLEGTARIMSTGNSRSLRLRHFTEDGETKYKDDLREQDNNLKILTLQRENVETDSLPLTENINFQLELAGSDENYIYVNPTLFAQFTHNPFLNTQRVADIDFGNLYSYSIRSLYKIPQGFKIDALPQSITMNMPDASIGFKRIVAQQEGQLLITYSIIYNKAVFAADEYPAIYAFYKKMYEMLNEQIVLKKG